MNIGLSIFLAPPIFRAHILINKLGVRETSDMPKRYVK